VRVTLTVDEPVRTWTPADVLGAECGIAGWRVAGSDGARGVMVDGDEIRSWADAVRPSRPHAAAAAAARP
jgi:hypothetical protein